MSTVKESLWKYLFQDGSEEINTFTGVSHLNRQYLQATEDIKPEIDVEFLITKIKNLLKEDHSTDTIHYQIRMYSWYYFFYYSHRQTRKLMRELLNTIQGQENLEQIIHNECSYLLCTLPKTIHWKPSTSQVRHMIQLLVHFRADNEMTRFLYREHIHQMIKLLHELSQMLLEVLLKNEIDYSNWETSSLFTSILSLLVDIISVDMTRKRGIEDPQLIFDLTRDCCQSTIIKVLDNVDSLKIPVYSVVNGMNLLVTVNPCMYSNLDVVLGVLDDHHRNAEDKIIDLVSRNSHLKIIYCIQLMNKAPATLLATNEIWLKVLETIMVEKTPTNDDILLCSITALNRWYKRIVGFLKSPNDLQCVGWCKNEFITKHLNSANNKQSIDLVVQIFAQKSTKLVIYLASDTFEMMLESLQLAHDCDHQIVNLMKSVLTILQMEGPNQKLSLKSHYLLKIMFEKSKNTSLLLKLIPHLKQNILTGLQDEHSFNKYSTLYALMIEYDNGWVEGGSTSVAAKSWLDCWLKPVLDIFYALPVGVKDLFVGQFIPKLYKSITKRLLKWVSMDIFQRQLFELCLNTDAIFIIVNKLKLNITQNGSPVDLDQLKESIGRAVRHSDGVLAAEGLRFILVAVSPATLIAKYPAIQLQFQMVGLFLEHHSNNESAIVRKRFLQELAKYFSRLVDCPDCQLHTKPILDGIACVLECCLDLLTPSTTFGQNTVACSVIQLVIKIFPHENAPLLKLNENVSIGSKNSIAFESRKLVEVLLVKKSVIGCLIFLLMDSYAANKQLICETICSTLKLTCSASQIYNVNDIICFISIILTYDIDNVSSTEFFSGYFLSILGLFDKRLVMEAFQSLDFPLPEGSLVDCLSNFCSTYDFLWSITLNSVKSYQNYPRLWSTTARLSTMRKFLSYPIHMLQFVDQEQQEFLVTKYGRILLDNMDRLLCYSSMVSNRVIDKEMRQKGIESISEEHVVLWWKITRDCCTLSSRLIELLLESKINPKSTEAIDRSGGELLGESIVLRICAHYLNIFIHGTHKGLYSATSDAFSRVLEAMWKRAQFRRIPQQLLSQVLSLIINDNNNAGGIFSIPRRKRSAGIPLFFQAIIESSPAQFRKTLVHTLLEEIGTTVVDTWKKVGRAYFPRENEHLLNSHVALLNILQHLVEMSSISHATESFVKEMFVFVVEGLGSEEFLVRNSCQLLYGKIYKRVFNPQMMVKKLTIQQFNTKYPTIFNDVIMLVGKYHKLLSANPKETHVKHYFYPICSLLHLLMQLQPACENNNFSAETPEQCNLTSHEQTLMISLSNLLQSLKSVCHMNLRQVACRCIVGLYSADWACQLFKLAYCSFKDTLIAGYKNGDIDESRLDELYGNYLYVKATIKVIASSGSGNETQRYASKINGLVDPILLSFIVDNHELRNTRMDLYCKGYIYDVHARLSAVLPLDELVARCTLKIAADLRFYEATLQECFQATAVLKSILKNMIKWQAEHALTKPFLWLVLDNIANAKNCCHWKLVANNVFSCLNEILAGGCDAERASGWLGIIFKLFSISTSYDSQSVSQEIMIKSLLLELQLLTKLKNLDYPTKYIQKCYSIMKNLDLDVLTTQNLILFVQWSKVFVDFYLFSSSRSPGVVSEKAMNEFHYLVWVCCKIVLMGSSVCRTVECRLSVVNALTQWKVFERDLSNSSFTAVAKELTLYSAFYATLTLIFDEDLGVRSCVVESLADSGNSSVNTAESSRSCCKRLFRLFHDKLVNDYSATKFECIFWDLLLDPVITDMIVNPTAKFIGVVRQLGINPMGDDCCIDFSLTLSKNSITERYKYGIFSSALNSHYEWDTVQNLAVDCLFSHYFAVDVFPNHCTTHSCAFLSWWLKSEGSSTETLQHQLRQRIDVATFEFLVGRVRGNLAQFDKLNSLVLYGTCLAFALLWCQLATDNSSQIAVISEELAPLPTHCLSHYKLNLLHQKLGSLLNSKTANS